jgi:hypothetical protein
MTAREIALAHLRRWTTSAARLPSGAALLEGEITPTTAWAIRHPATGAVFGWHADPDRLTLLYWESLAADDRCELVAAAVAALEKKSHRRAWTSAWRHWNRDAGARRRAVEEVVTAWVRGDRRDLDLALAALSEDPFPDDPAWLDGEDGELAEPTDARLALEYATAALVAGEVDLARHIYVYAEVAARDPSHLPGLLSMLTAAAGHLDDPPPPPAGRAPRPAGRLRGVGPRRVR